MILLNLLILLIDINKFLINQNKSLRNGIQTSIVYVDEILF